MKEKEIDLKQMFYHVVKKWRKLILVGLVGGLVVGGGVFAYDSLRLLDTEAVEKLRTDYEAKLAEHEVKGENIRREIMTTELSIENQTEYNEKSVLMEIDPYNEWNASLTVFIDTNYQIMPDLIYQNENPAGKITSVYGSFLGNGELYDYILSHISFPLERRYLQEILTVNSNTGSYSLTVSVRQQSKEYCDELLNLSWDAIQQKKPEVETSFGEHSLNMTNRSAFSQVNLSLDTYQKDNINLLTDLRNELALAKGNLLEWDLETVKKPAMDLKGCVKQGIIFMIIGGVVLAMIVAVARAFGYVFTERIMDADRLPEGLSVLGEIPKDANKKKFWKLDAFLAKVFGIIPRTSEKEQRIANVAMMIRSLVEESKEPKKIVLIGDVDKEQLAELAFAMNKHVDKKIKTEAAGNILADSEALQLMLSSDAAVLVIEPGKSSGKVLQQSLAKAEMGQTEILGVVLTQAEAVIE